MPVGGNRRPTTNRYGETWRRAKTLVRDWSLLWVQTCGISGRSRSKGGTVM